MSSDDAASGVERARSPAQARRAPVWRKALYSLLLTLTLLALVEGVAGFYVAIRDAGLLVVLQEEAHSRHDPELGWSHRLDEHLPDLYGPGRSLTTNAQGFRATEVFTREVPPDRYRVVCLGDSFTLGYGVDDSATIPAWIQRHCPTIQSVNMGQGGYGLDQAYLWYLRDGRELQADVLLLSVIDADFYRMQKLDFAGYPKPMLVLRNDVLEVTGVPVPRVWGARYERHLRGFLGGLAIRRAFDGSAPPLSASAEEPTLADAMARFDVAERLLDNLHALCRNAGRHFVLVYLPTKKIVWRQRDTKIAKWLGSYASRREVPLIDLRPTFSGLEPQQVLEAFRSDNHYEDWANGVVAEAILGELREHLPDIPR